MIDFQAWLSAHPLAATAIGWLVLSLLLWAFRPRTESEYDKLPPRLAAFLQLLRGLFGDGAKILEAARKLFSGVSLPPSADLPDAILRHDPEGRPVLYRRHDERGSASLPLLTLLAVVMTTLLGAYLMTGCTKHAGAATLNVAQRIEKQRVDYRAAVLECASRHALNCPAFDRCQKQVSAERGLPLIETTCTEVTPAEAADAGLIDGARQ